MNPKEQEEKKAPQAQTDTPKKVQAETQAEAQEEAKAKQSLAEKIQALFTRIREGGRRLGRGMGPLLRRVGGFFKKIGRPLAAAGRKASGPLKAAGRILRLIFVVPRSQLVYWTVKESVDLKEARRDDLKVYWQPLTWIAAKLLAVLAVSLWLFQFHTILAYWMEEGLVFFRLHEIYNFDLPGKELFRKAAAAFFIFVLGYHGLYFLIKQIQAFFSNLVVDTKNRQIYYVNSMLLFQEIHVIPVSDIDSYVIRQNLLTRLLRIGTVVIQKHRDEEITINTLFNAAGAMKRISRLQAAD